MVVGAGLAGLSAALHLAGRGRAVTVVEREPYPGGRVGRLDVDGYRIDTGPTVLTMPEIIDDTFAAVGETRSDRLELIRSTPPTARVRRRQALQVHSDADRMAAAVEEFAGPGRQTGYLRLRDWLTRLYQTEFDGFIAANFDSPLSLLTPQLARLAAIGGFRQWERVVNRYIADERLLRVFTFQSLYAGVPPQRALAVYAVIAYMDTISGVVLSARRDAGAARRTGRCRRRRRRPNSVTAQRYPRWNERRGSDAVRTEQGRRIACDAVVLTTELPQTYAAAGAHATPAARAAARAFGRRGPRRLSAPWTKPRITRSCSATHGSKRSPTSSATAAHGGSVAAGDPADRDRPDAGARGPRSALCAGARAQPRRAAPSIGTRPATAYVDKMIDAVGDRLLPAG